MDVLQLIIEGSDFQSVLKEIIVEEGLDPWNIDISKLSNSLLSYLAQLKEINFRIPARFILVSAILLRLKSEHLVEEEKAERELEVLNIDNLEILDPPISRIPARNITFEELTMVLERVMDKKERKEEIKLNREEKIRNLQKIVEMDIEDYGERVFREIARVSKTSFYTLTGKKDLLESARYFIAILHLANQHKVLIEQPELFEDINIALVGSEIGQNSVSAGI